MGYGGSHGAWRSLLAGAAALVLASCAAPARPWAGAAEDYFARFREAHAVGFTNLAAFYASDVAVDHGDFTHYRGVGRVPAVQSYRDLWQDVPVSFGDSCTSTSAGVSTDNRDNTEIGSDEPLYVSVDGAVDPVRLFADPFLVPAAFVYSVDRAGIRSEEFTGSAQAGKDILFRGVDAPVLRQLHGWVDRYVRAWAGRDPAAVQALYAPGADLRDTVAGIRLDGPAAIAGAAALPAAAGGLPGTSLHTIPDQGGPAYYGDRIPPQLVVLLLTVDEEGGCPGEVAVALRIAGGTITHEERYHRVDAVRRCATATATATASATASALPTGWWDQVTAPDPHAVTRTGTVTAQGRPVAVWNGTGGLQRLLRWGLQRFADDALAPPLPTSVTFLPDVEDARARYGFEHGSDAGDIALPFTAADACADSVCDRWTAWTKAATLHELAHTWLTRYATAAATARFLRATGLIWSDPARPWSQQGAEVAAETLTWGLMDQPYRVDVRLGTPSCTQLAHDFLLLTGADPDPRACAEPAPPGGPQP